MRLHLGAIQIPADGCQLDVLLVRLHELGLPFTRESAERMLQRVRDERDSAEFVYVLNLGFDAEEFRAPILRIDGLTELVRSKLARGPSDDVRRRLADISETMETFLVAIRALLEASK